MLRPARQFHHITTTKVYPAYLPYLHASKGLSRRWIAPTFVLAAVGLGITFLRTTRREQVDRMVAARQQESEHLKLRTKLLQDAYGDRTSLDELEKAIEVYETR
ncbi:hypothetical protein MKZ38_000241 [Zalerion maritima]|uniref:Uncharacterized protein n=1 Tax=Zalerion maritima TaxID=339359 RepID=A0AAD5RRP3_9PEZI|nr:hypothetical protein MKZ38_000241 [Zalerion maritima]